MNHIGRNVVLHPDALLCGAVTIGNNVTVHPGVVVDDGCVIHDGVVIGRPPRTAGNMCRQVPMGGPATIGAGTVIGANVVIYSGVKIGQRALIGDLTTIREGCCLDDACVIGHGSSLQFDTKIGARSRIGVGALLGDMLVEADVFLGPGVSNFNDNDVYLTRYGLTPLNMKGVVIRRFALVGTGATLAAGVEIGMGAIVAPAAMVTHSVSDWTVVRGVPARPMRLVDPAMRRRILGHFSLEDALWPSSESAQPRQAA
jgi:acetyltransferase-like isoleucine patch superfamily enzyme